MTELEQELHTIEQEQKSIEIIIEALQGNQEPLIAKILQMDAELSALERETIVRLLRGDIKKKPGRKASFKLNGEAYVLVRWLEYAHGYQGQRDAAVKRAAELTGVSERTVRERMKEAPEEAVGYIERTLKRFDEQPVNLEEVQRNMFRSLKLPPPLRKQSR